MRESMVKRVARLAFALTVFGGITYTFPPQADGDPRAVLKAQGTESWAEKPHGSPGVCALPAMVAHQDGGVGADSATAEGAINAKADGEHTGDRSQPAHKPSDWDIGSGASGFFLALIALLLGLTHMATPRKRKR